MKEWYSAADFAALDLPGVGGKRNRVVEYAAAQNWAERTDREGLRLARPRAGRGGGLEYHVSLLPAQAALEMARRGLLTVPQGAVNDDQDGAETAPATWDWFDQQNQTTKDEAKRRLIAIQAVELAVMGGLKKNAAVIRIAHDLQISKATIWNWFALVEGVDVANRLPALAPRRKGGGVKADIDPRLLTYFKSFYLRPSPVGFERTYRETVKEAKRLGIADSLPHPKTLTRRLRAEVPKDVIILKRQGMEAVIETLPPQKRTRRDLTAMQAVNIDGHKWDVFVRFPARNGQPERVGRAVSVVIQDLYSNKILAWRTGESESAVLTRLVAADLLKNWGIPQDFTLDNGRAFASKWMTGGAKTRFRFTIRDDEPLGLLTQLGIRVHWAKPHHGQAKPIERAFGDLEEIVSMSPACQGAYTGHHIDAKPEDYGTRAIDFDVFQAVVAAGIAEYNAQLGRTTENARGRSFDQTFAESYAAHPVGRATPEQLRLALLAAENVRANKRTGAVTLYGNTYYGREMLDLAGQMVTVRFDPQDLMGSAFIYKASGEFVCEAPIQAAVGFYDVEAAKTRAKMEGDLRKSVRKAAQLQSLISAADLAAQQLAATPDIPEIPTPTVVRPIRTRGSAAPAPRTDRVAYADRFTAAMAAMAPDAGRPRFQVFDGGLTPQSEPERPKK